jgi:hypothetical protein
MLDALFQTLDSEDMANAIRLAKRSVCYAAPGVHKEVAKAIAEASQRLGPEMITVCIDFDEHVLRMGFGDLVAVNMLRNVGLQINSTLGLRTGLLIVDHLGYVFTPTALFLESGRLPVGAPNAMRMSRDQVTQTLSCMSPAAKAIAIAISNSSIEKEKIRIQNIELKSEVISNEQFNRLDNLLKEVPPIKFDVARQVRVFNAYLQYVELKLSGAAIQRHRLAIPPSIQKFGGSADFEGRLKTTFDLIERGDELSSKFLEDKLNGIRKNFTRSLGKEHGRVVLKSAKQNFELRINEFREELMMHQLKVKKDLQQQLDISRKQIIDYYVPHVVQNPPDAMKGQFQNFTESDARYWLDGELERIFPRADTLIKKMQLDVRYKDVTFETLNQNNFLEAVKEAFPRVDWDKAYSEFRAAGEQDQHARRYQA